MPRRKELKIPDAILDQLLAGADPKTAFDPNGLLDGLKKALAERALNAEMDHHLSGEEAGNSRNGYGRKSVLTDTGKIELEVPRDRQASFYPLVFFDALRVKVRDEGLVRNKAVHIALGVRADGGKEVLGLWLEQNEGAKFWLRVMTELKNRGVEDVLMAVVDGLKGFPEAIVAVFPEATVQTCIVHLLRQSLAFVAHKDRKAVAAALKEIYRALDATAGEAALAAFEEGSWGRKYPAIGQSWRRAWGEVVPFYAFPVEVRRLLYTTNAIEALNSKLRRAVRARGHTAARMN